MARRAGLTVRAIEAAKPRQSHYDLPDVWGLTLRVHPNGRKVWMVRATNRRTGERVRREMAEFGEGPGRLTLSQAHTKGAEWRGMIEAGIDPAKPHGALTVAAAVEGWLTDAGLKSGAMVRRRLELHVLPTFGKRLLGEVEQRDISALLRDLRHSKKLTSEVNRVRGSLSALWTWAMKQGEVERNPVLATAKVQEPSLERERAGTLRVLALDELASVWRAAKADSSPIVSALLRLLILVPLRREEWTRVTWAEIDIDGTDRWTLKIPAARMKGNRPHAVPLPQAAVELLKPMCGGEGFIFSVTGGHTPFAGWKRAAARIANAADLKEPWVLHDLRRGVATAMGDAGVREMVIARILAHSPKSFLGVTRTYERSDRGDEVRDALERWAAVLEGAVTSQAEATLASAA